MAEKLEKTFRSHYATTFSMHNGFSATGDTPLPQSSSLTLPSPLSEMEAKFYYAGLPSCPVLVARTSTTPWEAPTGPEESWNLKELRPANRR